MFDFIKEIVNSFRQNSLERVKSPFLGAFVFSWLSFNWQMLAILFMSKSNILTRLKYINDNFDVGSLIFGPICTTALICIILPSAHKYVTKFQKKTNHDTNELNLSSKIDIAEKQLVLADYEAKKKLADERERKNIDANIASVISARDQLDTSLKDAKVLIENQQKNNDLLISNERELKNTIAELSAKIHDFSDANKEYRAKIAEYENLSKRWEQDSDEMKKMRATIEKITQDLLQMSLDYKNESDEKFKLVGEVRALKDENASLNSKIINNPTARGYLDGDNDFSSLAHYGKNPQVSAGLGVVNINWTRKKGADSNVNIVNNASTIENSKNRNLGLKDAIENDNNPKNE